MNANILIKKIFIMKNILTIILGCLLITSCEHQYISDKFELRQLVQGNQNYKNSNGTFFLIYGTYSSSEGSNAVVKMFANVDGYYQLLQYKLSDIKIRIDNKIQKPYLYFYYNDISKYNNAELISYSKEYNYIVPVIVCPEKYLPEKLLPISN